MLHIKVVQLFYEFGPVTLEAFIRIVIHYDFGLCPILSLLCHCLDTLVQLNVPAQITLGPEWDMCMECDKYYSASCSQACKRLGEWVGGWNSHYIDLKIKPLCICSV